MSSKLKEQGDYTNRVGYVAWPIVCLSRLKIPKCNVVLIGGVYTHGTPSLMPHTLDTIVYLWYRAIMDHCLRLLCIDGSDGVHMYIHSVTICTTIRQLWPNSPGSRNFIIF